MVVCTFQNSNMMSELRGVCNRYQRRWRKSGMSRALARYLLSTIPIDQFSYLHLRIF